MYKLALAHRIELETRKRLHAVNAEAFTIFNSCITFLPQNLEVTLYPDPELYDIDATESFRKQLRDIHQHVKEDLM